MANITSSIALNQLKLLIASVDRRKQITSILALSKLQFASGKMRKNKIWINKINSNLATEWIFKLPIKKDIKMWRS